MLKIKSEWISEKSLEKRWGLDDLELRQIVIEHRLPAYVESGIGRPRNIWKLSGFYYNPNGFILTVDMSTLLFKMQDIERFEREHGFTPKKTQAATGTILPCPEGTKWQDIKITLIANDMVRIKTPQGEDQFTHTELQMGKETGMLWSLLKLFAQKKGFISRENVKYDRRLPDNARLLNKHLKKLFQINESIYLYHYKVKRAYITRIKFDDETYKETPHL